MNTLDKIDLPWEVITIIGLDKLSPECLHLYNAILYGLAERYQEHGLEWIREHAQEIRTQICAAARYAGKDICQGRSECQYWDKASVEATLLLNAHEPAPQLTVAPFDQGNPTSTSSDGVAEQDAAPDSPKE